MYKTHHTMLTCARGPNLYGMAYISGFPIQFWTSGQFFYSIGGEVMEWEIFLESEHHGEPSHMCLSIGGEMEWHVKGYARMNRDSSKISHSIPPPHQTEWHIRGSQACMGTLEKCLIPLAPNGMAYLGRFRIDWRPHWSLLVPAVFYFAAFEKGAK